MRRRSLLAGLIALAAGGAAGLRPQPLAASEAPNPGAARDAAGPGPADRAIALPDGTPVDWSQSRRHDPWYWDRHHRRRRRRRVCRTHWDRWGRRYTRCRWV